jgi:glucokinase
MMVMVIMSMLLAGDIGGTKTNLGLFSLTDDQGDPCAEETFPSQEYHDLETIVREFIARHPKPVKHAVFGVAGPVIAGQAKITNLPWSLDEKALAAALGLSSVYLVNDLEAIATGVPFLGRSDIATLNQGRPDPEGAIAVIAPGTGLGEAFITLEGSRYHVHPSEGGHADFAPTSDVQVELLSHLRSRLDHVSYEEVCSGIGIRNVHAFFREKRNGPESPESHARELEAAEDPVPLIVKAALGRGGVPRCDTCLSTLEVFCSILGAEAGNLALKVLATGGVYVGGGIPLHALPLLKRGPFMASFSSKGRLSRLVSRIPVHVILDQGTPLLGAARFGMERIRRTEEHNHRDRRHHRYQHQDQQHPPTQRASSTGLSKRQEVAR